MVVKSKVAIFFISFMCVACAKPNSTHREASIFLSRQIQLGMPNAYSKEFGSIIEIKRHQLIFDTDGDGIVDKNDPDIDNDGVFNECDSAPFILSVGNSDSDHDGIPNFCDINPYSDSIQDKAKAVFQKNIFLEYNIIIFEDDRQFNELDIPFLQQLVVQISKKTKLPNTKLHAVVSTSKLASKEYGSYDEDWASIRYARNDINFIPSVKLWEWALVHEFFHFVAVTNIPYFTIFNDKYLEELNSGTLIYPTEYAKTDSSEFFAELETAHFFEIY